MRRIDLLVSQSRRVSGNAEFTDETGIQDEEFLYWATAGQERLHGRILQAHNEVFLREKEIDVVAQQDTYAIPVDAYLGTRVEKIEYSITGLARDYYPLEQVRLLNRDSLESANPDAYIRRDRSLILQPKPQGAGKIRVTYQYALPRLDKRRGTVSAVTLDTVARTITALTLDTTVFLDATRLAEEAYLSVVDKDGNIQMKNIPVVSVNETTGVVTLSPGFVYEAGETLAAGNYVVLGAYASTHSQLPDAAERYLLEFMNWKAYKNDSSSDSAEETTELVAIEDEIVLSYSEADMDTDGIPVINSDYLTNDGW